MAGPAIMPIKRAEIYTGKDIISGVDSNQGKNGRHPHDKNAGIVFYVGFILHSSAK